MSTIVLTGKINLAFIHIPRTGGTSIGQWIKARAAEQKLTYREYIFFPTDQEIFEKHGKIDTVVSVVRNPWERMVSFYHYFKEIEQNGPDYYMLQGVDRSTGKPTPPFDHWLQKLHTYSNYQTDSFWTEMHRMNGGSPEDAGTNNFWFHVMTPQTKWLSQDPSILIRFENLEEDFQPLRDIFSSNRPLPKLRPSRHNYYRTYYNDDKLKDIVSKCYAEDIERWRYRLEY